MLFVKVSSINIESYFQVGPIGTAGVKYLDNKSLTYWFEYMDSYRTLYFQYNSCTENPSFQHNLLIFSINTTT